MLQPRLSAGDRCVKMFVNSGMLAVVIVAVVANVVICQEYENDAEIEVSRIKRDSVPENRDLTVLLLNDQKRTGDFNTKIGRYHNVKPLIGLLTSTARTFIQDGVTTEYATQILGTTLDNGRIYAQLLTKSSLVLYNKPNNDDAVEVKPTRIHSDFDGEWNLKQDLGIIDPEKFVLKNTDYIQPNSKMAIVYASKPADNLKYWNSGPEPEGQTDNQVEEPTGRRVQQYNEIPRFLQNDAYNYLEVPIVRNEKKVEVAKPTTVEHVAVKPRQPAPTAEVKFEHRVKEETFNDSNVSKVKPDYELPTFTIKNEFSPLFYYIDNVESKGHPQAQALPNKSPKRLFGQKSESRPKKTFTYAGFADFTTVVGDTVIVFTPNTEVIQERKVGQVDVVPSVKSVDKLGAKITFLPGDIPVPTATYKRNKQLMTKRPKPTPTPEDKRSDKALYKDRNSLEKVLYEVDKMPDTVNVQYNAFDFNMDVIQPSEAAITTTERTRFTEDLEVIPLPNYNSKATDPLMTLSTSVTLMDTPEDVSVTDPDSFTTTESEEGMDVSKEVTDYTDEIPTTTENNTSEKELSEEVDAPSTGDSEETDSREPICTEGIFPVSTMTTAYRTLTYLTTYFIPAEDAEDQTTTSIKSEVVVESNVGYLTNYECKQSDSVIQPTAVVKDTKTTILSSEQNNEDIADIEVTTETKTTLELNNSELKEPSSPRPTTVEAPEVAILNNKFGEPPSTEKPTESATENTTEGAPKTTTTERTTSSESHVETTVTEKAQETTTEKLTTPAVLDDGENLNNTENEIDLIYKTLYTTYTYFTTFFQGSTSSIASHKSVVTNVVTSTIDLAQLDPAMLAAFDDKEIAPTSVGIGRPTEAIHSVIDLFKNKDVIESVESDRDYNSQTETPSLNDENIRNIKPDVVKTYYTTYTFFTTIYVGSDANICSRSEVYTNYVGPDELLPTKTNPLEIESTKKEFDFRNCKQMKQSDLTTTEASEEVTSESNISKEDTDKYHSYSSIVRPRSQDTPTEPSPVEVDMLFSVESNPLESENIYVTDVKSSYSKGERKFLDSNNVYDDQISSESNIEEIEPSPTLLLQTSYTTFTYFTTMYIGKDSSKIKSRLETITNVVTETLAPKKEAELEENNLPITYYTTFTYWTTLYKDKTTTITSREEIISNVVTPPAQTVATVSPIDTTPIDIEKAPKELEIEIKPSVLNKASKELLEQEDEKATFYTTYTYFTTFYVGNTSQIRSSLETVTNIVDNTKDPINDNQLARSIGKAPADKNLVSDAGEKPDIVARIQNEDIKPTKLPELGGILSTTLSGTFIDNLYAEIKPVTPKDVPKEGGEKKILYSQVAVISGDSTIITSDNKVLKNANLTTTEAPSTALSPNPEVIESSVPESTTLAEEKEDEENEEDDEVNTRLRSRLTFQPKKPTFTPVIRPFASRNRPVFSPKRVVLTSSATTITRSDFTPTITATPTLKSVKSAGYGGNRKQPAQPHVAAPSPGRRFSGRNGSNASFNTPAPARAPPAAGFRNRQEAQSQTPKRAGFRTTPVRNNAVERSSSRIRPTAAVRIRGGRQSVSASPPPVDDSVVNESETHQELESSTELAPETSEPPTSKTTNPLSRFRRPVARVPGTAVTPRSTTAATTRKGSFSRGRSSTTTQRTTTRATSNPLFSLRSRQRPNALFPRRGLFKQPDQQEEEEKNNQQEVDAEQGEDLNESEDFEDNDYESSDRREQQVSTTTTTTTAAPKRAPNGVQIRPFGFRRRTKRQVDYGNRKYSNFRRPGARNSNPSRRVEPEPETEAPTTQRQRVTNRFSGRANFATTKQPTTAAPARTSRQPFILRGESRTSTPSISSYRSRNSKASGRTTTSSSRPKPPRLTNYNSQTERARSSTARSSGRSRSRGSSRATTRQRTNNDFGTDTKNVYQPVNDGKITVTHHIPSEVTISVVKGKITEYKNILTAKPSVEVLLPHQYSTTVDTLGNPQLVLVADSTLVDNGVTKVIKYVLHEIPTSAVVFTPTTIRGRKTLYSHIVPSTVYNVEYLTSTLAPEINANVPLANLLLSQLLLGNNQQQQINPLLALQGQGLIPQQPLIQTPVTELKTRTTTYVTTVIDARETVLPITFRGKEILTTIVDPTTNVVTATEFITETIVTTPTVFAPQQNQQLNSLLLPLLLQQQQQQQVALQAPNPLLALGQQQDLSQLHNINNPALNNDIYNNSPKPNVLDITSNEEYAEYSQENSREDLRDEPLPPPPKPVRNKPRAPKPAPPKLTSVVTLYVSGRTPGEFSTVLSTVVTDDTQTVRKREAIYYEDVDLIASDLPSIEELYSSQSDNVLENSLAIDDKLSVDAIENQLETQSLESILGEVSSQIKLNVSPTYVVRIASPSIVKYTRKSLVDDVS